MSEVHPTVEIEEVVCEYEPANNGAGPMWCYGSPLLVRGEAGVFAAVPETGRDAAPLCNTRWCLYRRDDSGWVRVHAGSRYDEREPCPLVQLSGRALYLSVNPAQDPGVERGPCEPMLLEFLLIRGCKTRSGGYTGEKQTGVLQHSAGRLSVCRTHTRLNTSCMSPIETRFQSLISKLLHRFDYPAQIPIRTDTCHR